jgi:RNA polymerase sigma-70 factor, ECF subfamily
MDEVKEQRSLSLQDEESLVRRAQEKNPHAFAELYEAYFDKIYRYTVMRIRNETEAEDITQQVL